MKISGSLRELISEGAIQDEQPFEVVALIPLRLTTPTS